MSLVISEPTLPPKAIDSVIVVGAGLAGLRTSQALREFGFAGKITVIGGEALLPYDRPPLSKKLFEHDSPVFLADDINANLHDFASEVLLSTTVTGLSRSGSGWQVAATSSISDDTAGIQHNLYADAVVLAVGSTPVVPQQWQGVSSLYSWQDALDMRAKLGFLEEASQTGSKRPNSITIIGAGWIGTEVAAVAAHAGYDVTVIEGAATPLNRQLGGVVGARVATWFEQAGIDLHTDSMVTSVAVEAHESTLSAGNHVVTFVDSTGTTHTINSDAVLSAVGATPNAAWLRGIVPLTERGAVPTNEWGQVVNQDAIQASENQQPLSSSATSSTGISGLDLSELDASGLDPSALDPSGLDQSGIDFAGLYAVGDCAHRSDPVLGEVIGGHWNTALHDPALVARHIVKQINENDQTIEVNSVTPHVFSTQFSKDLNLFGSPDPQNDSVIFREDQNENWTALYVKEQKGDTALLSAVFTVDSPRDAAQARKLLSQGPTLINIEKARDTKIPLKLAKQS